MLIFFTQSQLSFANDTSRLCSSSACIEEGTYNKMDLPPTKMEKPVEVNFTLQLMDIRPVHKNLFLEFPKKQGRFMLHLIYKQLLEMVFCSIIAPSLSSVNHLFYRAKYISQSCPNHVWAITLTGVH